MKKANLSVKDDVLVSNGKDRKEETRPLSVKEFRKMVKQRKSAPHIVEGILPNEPGEYSLLAGRPGLGKTNLGLQMAFCIATGNDFLGFKCQKARVCYIGFEGTKANLADRLKKMEKEFPDSSAGLFIAMLPMARPDELLLRMFEVTIPIGCKVVIVDPVKFIVAGQYITAKDASPFIQKLKACLVEAGQVAFLISHIRKPANIHSLIQVQDVYNVRGASEYVDSASSVLLMEKEAYGKQGVVRLGFAKQREVEADTPPMRLFFDGAKCLFYREKEVSTNGAKVNLYIPKGN